MKYHQIPFIWSYAKSDYWGLKKEEKKKKKKDEQQKPLKAAFSEQQKT